MQPPRNQVITQEWIDTYVPEHGRTSCNDVNLENGYQNMRGFARCIRCLLMRNLGKTFESLPVIIRFEVIQEVIYDGEEPVIRRQDYYHDVQNV